MVPTQEHLQWAKGDAAADSPTRCEGAWFTYKELMTSLAGIGGADQERAEHAEKKEKERKQAE